MDYDSRQSGIEAVGEISWGTHFCQFYREQADLTETLVPYFEAGLKNNESCLWVTAEKLEADVAEGLMVDALPDFKRYISSGQIQILSIKDWYTAGHVFSADDVLQGWIDKEAESKSKGFSGLRLTGDTFWVDRSGWNDFMEYENKVNQAFRRYKLVALCTYCMDKCSAEDVIDVCCHHQFALVRRQGNWELLESSSLKIAKEELTKLNTELELRVDARTAELNMALQAREEFLAMLGHELRNPLAPIRNATQVIRALTPPHSPISANIAILDRQVSHITRLVDDLLDIGRITQGQISLNLKPTSLSEIMDQALELARPIINIREHSLSVTLPSSHVKVNADAIRLAQVFGNLLYNAAKYTPDGGNVTMSGTVEGESVVVSVGDSGAGIPQTMLSSIFNLFTQLPRSLARSDGGLGVGLTLVKSITEMHGGSVEAFSEGVGKGAQFTVRLPITHAQIQDPVSAPTDGLVLKTETPRKVLIVDDNKDCNQSLMTLLEITGHEVACVYDGLSGINMVKAFCPDVILLDIGLPVIDGYEVVRRLKADFATRDIYVIALTGYGQSRDVLKAREAGCDAHLLKPARLEEILKLIDDAPKVTKQ